MQTIFEIFDPMTGKTEGYKNATGRDQYISRMDHAGYVRDYLPASGEGFYVTDMRGSVKAGPFDDRVKASNKADYENMCSDVNAFSVVEHRI